MKKYENAYEMPYNITHDSKYYFNAFCREIKRGEGATAEERREIALASIRLFHNYTQEKERAFESAKKIKEGREDFGL